MTDAPDELLDRLCQACGTPGNELAVRAILESELERCGYRCQHSRWTDLIAHHPKNTGDRPLVVVTAHQDSPGFIVRELGEDGMLDCIALGGIEAADMHGRMVRVVTPRGDHPGVLQRPGRASGRATDYQVFLGTRSREALEAMGIQKGDSVIFAGAPIALAGDHIAAPHLDDRLGCYMLVAVGRRLRRRKLPVDLVLAATSAEEMGGRGARIVAGLLQPDLAICLDTTYEEGSVRMGGGPAITLSDASVLLSPGVRDQILGIADRRRVPVQLEVYNVAGTDASAFRDVGEGCLTICPLIPTLNNHGPHEIAHLADVKATIRLVSALIEEALIIGHD